jgi:hypothetical protein
LSKLFYSFFQPDDSLDDSREATPDSDSGYVVSAAATTAAANFNHFRNDQAIGNKGSPQQHHQDSRSSQFAPDVIRRRVVEQPSQPAQPVRPVAGKFQPQLPSPSSDPSSLASSMTLADQLKTRLEERRRSREGNETVASGVVTSPTSGAAIPSSASHVTTSSSSSFVPESIAVDIQRAVQVANESSKNFLLSLQFFN